MKTFLFSFVLFFISLKKYNSEASRITHVAPDKLRIGDTQKIHVKIDDLPEGELFCTFTLGDKEIFTAAIRQSEGINCRPPKVDLLPRIPYGEAQLNFKLSVRPENGPDLASTDLVFFDCNKITSCTRCVSSNFPCDWCTESHRCTHDGAQNCPNNIIVIGLAQISSSYRKGPEFCPKIEPSGEDGSEIRVSSGSRQRIRVKAHISYQSVIQSRFQCQFNIEGRVKSVNAQLLDDWIYCDPMEFLYTSRSQNLTVPFAVIWDGSKPLDNPDNIQVVIVNHCRQVAISRWDACLALPKEHKCGWCFSSNSCEMEDQCNQQGLENPDWISREPFCTK